MTKVEFGTQLVDESGKTLDLICTAVTQVSDIISEIANSTNEQNVGVNQINNSITDLDGMTQQNAALVSKAASSAESMDEETNVLAELMRFFNVGESRG